MKERDHLKDLGIGSRRIILKYILNKECEGVNCVLPDQESVQWGALVSTVMNIRIS
jgi:hypothetical protein